jgi:hypothetical protein
LIVTGGNPYDIQQIAALQAVQRPDLVSSQGTSFIAAWNPPYLFVVLLPLGLLPYNLAVSSWILINVLCIGLSLVLCWDTFTHPFDERGFLVLLALSLAFFHTLVLIVLGQISGLILLFLVLGFWLLEKKHDFLAGMALLVVSSKPQLVYFIFLIGVVWIIRQKRWKVVWGMLAGALASAVIMWIVFPGWLGAYLSLLRSLPYNEVPTSTLGDFMYRTFHTSLFRYAGVLLLPFTPTFVRLVEREGWLQAASIALPLSLPLSPYGFGVDQILVLPVFVQIFAWVRRGALKAWVAWSMLLGYLAIQFFLFSFAGRQDQNSWGFALPWFVLALYWLARSSMKSASAIS